MPTGSRCSAAAPRPAACEQAGSIDMQSWSFGFRLTFVVVVIVIAVGRNLAPVSSTGRWWAACKPTTSCSSRTADLLRASRGAKSSQQARLLAELHWALFVPNQDLLSSVLERACQARTKFTSSLLTQTSIHWILRAASPDFWPIFGPENRPEMHPATRKSALFCWTLL